VVALDGGLAAENAVGGILMRRGAASAPWSQSFGEEVIGKETTRAATTDDPRTFGCVQLLIASPSTDSRIRRG
jgi:hypothetical protein